MANKSKELVRFLGASADVMLDNYVCSDVLGLYKDDLKSITGLNVIEEPALEKVITVPSMPKLPFMKIVGAAVGAFFLLGGIALLGISKGLGIFFIILGAVCLLYGLPKTIKYIKAFKPAHDAKAAAQEKWHQQVDSNAALKRKYTDDIQRAMDNAPRGREIVLGLKDEFTAALNKSYDAIKAAESTGVLHEKYFKYVNLEALKSYIETGRVSTIEGRNGAVQLLEEEIRQDKSTGTNMLENTYWPQADAQISAIKKAIVEITNGKDIEENQAKINEFLRKLDKDVDTLDRVLKSSNL